MRLLKKLLLPLLITTALAGCSTMAGAGQDISAGGQALTNAASSSH